MGKLLHKLVHGIMPSWLFTGFRRPDSSSKKLLHFRLKHGIHFKSSSPTLPSSSSAPNTQLVDVLIDMDQSTYYYSQSEEEQERPITGNSDCMSSPNIERKSPDEGDDDQIQCASHDPKMGICALAAASIMKGRWHEDKHRLLPSANDKMKYPTSPESIYPQNQYDTNDDQHYNQQEGCLDHTFPLQHQTRELKRSSRETMKKDERDNGHCGHGHQHQHQHQPLHNENHQQHQVAGGQTHGNQPLQHHANNGPDTNQHPQHHADDKSLCQHNAHHYHYNNCHVSEFPHHAGDGSLCQHDDDDDVYHNGHHNNHVYKYLHHAEDGSLCMHHGSEYRHHASNSSLCQHHDDVHHHHAHHYHYKNRCVYEYHHHGDMYCRSNLLHISKHGRTKPNMRRRPISSLAKTAKTGTQHNYGHHHLHHHHHRNQCQNDNQHYHHPHFRGFKRKSICLDENNEQDCKDENKYHCSICPWPWVKRQKTHMGENVACELPECISQKVGDGCAVVQYSYQNPQFAFWESMVKMIIGNELWGRSQLEFLLHCYLALNDPHLHHTICTSFLQVLKDLQQSLLLWAPVDSVNTA